MSKCKNETCSCIRAVVFCKLHKFARLTRRNYGGEKLGNCIQNKVTRAFSFFMGFGLRHIKTQKPSAQKKKLYKAMLWLSIV